MTTGTAAYCDTPIACSSTTGTFIARAIGIVNIIVRSEDLSEKLGLEEIRNCACLGAVNIERGAYALDSQNALQGRMLPQMRSESEMQQQEIQRFDHEMSRQRH
eukprot:c3965_g1_i1.p3 GENE.c3965_g1_i1~~c3965_g1_i1.p3  ORF type:complete len:104 (-),score=16.42 c3965_g1_i1:375-686(-)